MWQQSGTDQMICLKFEVARQASSPSFCVPMRAVPWADEAEQQLSRLAPSGCELCRDYHTFRARLQEVPIRDLWSMLEV